MTDTDDVKFNTAELENLQPKRSFFRRKNKTGRKRPKWKKFVKIIIALVLVATLAFAGFHILNRNEGSNGMESETRTATVERQTIQSSISSSGTLAALDTYTITSLVSGEVISADFEKGDQVEKGDVLYRIDTGDVDERIESAQTSLERAQERYQEAQENYDEAAEDYQSLDYVSPEEGYVQAVYVEVGDTVNSGDKLVDLYNDRTMVLKVPFLNTDANQISAGDTAQVQILETYETVSGTVTAVSSMEQTLSGGSVVRMVTIEVGNPGGISTSSTAAATVNGLACSGDGTFTAKLEETVTADHGGEIASMAVEEGSYVHEGATLFTYTQESADDALQTVQDSLETAEQSVEDAESELENTQDSLEDYEITAPISGQVIVKNTKAGDTLNSGGDSNTAMAIIYDISALTFDMYVDELDVLDVEVGQKVEVTVDAFEGETFTGQVTNVSLESTSSNGVTQYPVTVQMDEVGDLLPGMNVNGEIIIDEAENALAIPAQALQRGNVVYVQDDSVTEAQGNVPAGFRSVEVETGLISEDYVEIKSGLSEGDVVYIDPTTSTDSTTMMGMGGMPGGGMPSGGGGMPGGGGGMPGGGGGGRGGPGGGF